MSRRVYIQPVKEIYPTGDHYKIFSFTRTLDCSGLPICPIESFIPIENFGGRLSLERPYLHVVPCTRGCTFRPRLPPTPADQPYRTKGA
jgi:hypothetical protein